MALGAPPTLPQNLSLNIAEKGFPISVYNRSYDKTEAAVARAQKEGASWLQGATAAEPRCRRAAPPVPSARILCPG
jgi:hypothetical protein